MKSESCSLLSCLIMVPSCVWNIQVPNLCGVCRSDGLWDWSHVKGLGLSDVHLGHMNQTGGILMHRNPLLSYRFICLFVYINVVDFICLVVESFGLRWLATFCSAALQRFGVLRWFLSLFGFSAVWFMEVTFGRSPRGFLLSCIEDGDPNLLIWLHAFVLPQHSYPESHAKSFKNASESPRPWSRLGKPVQWPVSRRQGRLVGALALWCLSVPFVSQHCGMVLGKFDSMWQLLLSSWMCICETVQLVGGFWKPWAVRQARRFSMSKTPTTSAICFHRGVFVSRSPLSKCSTWWVSYLKTVFQRFFFFLKIWRLGFLRCL